MLVSLHDTEVMCKLAGVFVPRLVESSEHEWIPSPTRQCSSAGFLETGGLGGLGLLAAAQIRKYMRPSLSLISRSRSVSHGFDILDIMHTQRSVALVCCDVSKAHGIAHFISSFHQQSVSTTGLLHASGTQAFTAITDQHPVRFEQTLGPKCSAALEFSGLLAAHPVQRVIMFSSTSALIGLSRCCDYSAANAYMDALISWRRTHALAGAAPMWGNVYALGMGGHFGMPPSLYAMLFCAVLRRTHESGTHIFEMPTIRHMSSQLGITIPLLSDWPTDLQLSA
jgi:hypothetical protein